MATSSETSLKGIAEPAHGAPAPEAQPNLIPASAPTECEEQEEASEFSGQELSERGPGGGS
ncbi:hypothetical protein JCM10295v2_005806 [Rhodotorula toruloides]